MNTLNGILFSGLFFSGFKFFNEPGNLIFRTHILNYLPEDLFSGLKSWKINRLGSGCEYVFPRPPRTTLIYLFILFYLWIIPATWLSGNVISYWSKGPRLSSRLCREGFFYWRIIQATSFFVSVSYIHVLSEYVPVHCWPQVVGGIQSCPWYHMWSIETSSTTRHCIVSS